MPLVAWGGRGPAEQYREFVPDVTSTDAGDAASAPEPLAVPTDPRQPDVLTAATGRDPWTVTSVVIAAVLIAACVAGALSAIVPSRTEIPGLPTAGTITELLLPAVKAIFDLSAALTVGWLLAAAWLAPPQKNGMLDVGGYRAIKAASLAATVWSVSGFALIPLLLSDTLGRPINQSISADWLISGISILDSVRAALIAAIAAALIAVIARVVLHPGWAAVLLGVALIAVIAQSDTGHAAGTSDHDVAIDTMVFHLVGISLWVGGLVAFLGLARQHVPAPAGDRPPILVDRALGVHRGGAVRLRQRLGADHLPAGPLADRPTAGWCCSRPGC